MSAWSVKTRRAPSRHCRHCRDARVYGHTTTAMHDTSTPPSSRPSGDPVVLHREVIFQRSFFVRRHDLQMTMSGFRREIPSLGFPVAGKDGERGDLIIDFEVVFPPRLTEEHLSILTVVLTPEEIAMLVDVLKLMSARTVRKHCRVSYSWVGCSVGTPEGFTHGTHRRSPSHDVDLPGTADTFLICMICVI